MTCRDLGQQVGLMVNTCCGGKESLIPLFHCLETTQSAKFAVPNSRNKGTSLVQIGSQRSIETVVGCMACQFRTENGRQEKPVDIPFGASVPRTTRAVRDWEETRRRKGIPVQRRVASR